MNQTNQPFTVRILSVAPVFLLVTGVLSALASTSLVDYKMWVQWISILSFVLFFTLPAILLAIKRDWGLYWVNAMWYMLHYVGVMSTWKPNQLQPRPISPKFEAHSWRKLSLEQKTMVIVLSGVSGFVGLLILVHAIDTALRAMNG